MAGKRTEIGNMDRDWREIVYFGMIPQKVVKGIQVCCALVFVSYKHVNGWTEREPPTNRDHHRQPVRPGRGVTTTCAWSADTQHQLGVTFSVYLIQFTDVKDAEKSCSYWGLIDLDLFLLMDQW